MALSLKEKKFLELCENQPEEMLKEIINNTHKVNIDNFANNYLQYGYGLLHVLMKGCVDNPNKYLPLLLYVISLPKFDIYNRSRINGDESAFDVFIKKSNFFTFKPSVEQIKTLITVLKTSKTKKIKDLIKISAVIYKESKDLFFDLYDSVVLPILKDLGQNDVPIELEKLLRNVIENDDIELFEKIISDFKINNSPFNFLNFMSLSPNGRVENEKANILTYAIYYKAKKISNYILDNNILINISKSTKPNYYYYNYQKRNSRHPIVYETHPIIQAVANEDLELYKKIYNKLTKEEKNSLIRTNSCFILNGGIGVSTDNFLSYLLKNQNPQYLKVIIDDIASYDDIYRFLAYAFTNVTDFKKCNMFLELLQPHLPFKNKDMGQVYSKVFILNSFLLYLRSNINTLSEENMGYANNCINILKKYNLIMYNPKVFFNCEYFVNSKINDFSVNHGLVKCNEYEDVEKNVFKLYLGSLEMGCAAKNSQEWRFADFKEKDEKLEKLIEQEKLIVDKLFSAYPSDLCEKDMMVKIYEKNAKLLLNAINKNGFKDYLKDIDVVLHIKNNQIDLNVLKEIIELNFQFFSNENKYFYHLMKENMPLEYLITILTKENKKISELSNDCNFWENINNDEMMQYVKSNGAIFDNIEVTKYLALGNSTRRFELYLKNGGTTILKDDGSGNNLLHWLIKNKKYRKADVVLEYHPSLALEKNKQKKYPIDYILPQLNKSIITKLENEKIVYQVLEKMLNVSKIIFDKEKSLKYLEESKKNIKKYSSMNNYNNLEIMLEELILDKKLSKKDGNVKKLKI